MRVIRGESAGQAFQYCRHLSAAPRRGWNKVWAGNALYGWRREIVTREPIRLAALEATRSEAIRGEIQAWLMARWNNSPGIALSSDAERLGRELGLGTHSDILSASELRFLQRINLDRHDLVSIEQWRWSTQAGVAFLSDGGRETVKPELACSRVIESVSDDCGVISNQWRAGLGQLDAEREALIIDDFPFSDRFSEAVEFWGLGKAWAGGVKIFPPGRGGFKKFLEIG